MIVKMKMKKLFIFFFAAILILCCAVPALAAPAQTEQAASVESFDDCLRALFGRVFEKIKSRFASVKYYIAVKKEGVPNTMYNNAIHMLRSVEDTIGDSFIITTKDGKVMVIDGGHKFETEYFIQYLKQVTGEKVPKVDAWFLSHPHFDHVEVFYEIAENRANRVSFDRVLLNFAPLGFYDPVSSEEGAEMVAAFDRISKAFPEKVRILHDGDRFNIGDALIRVLYTFDPAFDNVNESSCIFRMDLGGKSVLFTGDAGVRAGGKVLANPEYKALVQCDICKMAHHGQDGVDKAFYEAVSPEICLWPTPTWVWNNTNGNLQTLEVRAWMQEIGVRKHYVAWEGSQVIYL